ncbi:MAG: hypothetical protein ABSE79_02230 [Terriglobia bacterium]|jgi:hypothetical protein
MKTKDKCKMSRNGEAETNRQPHLSGRIPAVGGLRLDFSTPQLLADECGYSSAPRLLEFRNNHPLPPPYQEGD